LFLVVGLLEFGYAFFFCSQEKNCCVPRGSHLWIDVCTEQGGLSQCAALSL
jgi:hypothetical protein